MSDHDPLASLRSAPAWQSAHDDVPEEPGELRPGDPREERPTGVTPRFDGADGDVPSFDQLKTRFEAVMVAEAERRQQADATAERLSRHIDQMMAAIETQRRQLAEERARADAAEARAVRAETEGRQLRRMLKGVLDYLDRGSRDRLAGLANATEERLASTTRPPFLSSADR